MCDRREESGGLGREGLDLLLELTTLLGADMERDLRARGLTQSRVPLLWILGELGPSPQRVLAHRMGVSARNVTGLVDALVATGFVTREAHPGDGRAVLVTLTERGEAEVSSLQMSYQGLAGQLFGNMSPKQAADVVAGLTHVVDQMKALAQH